MKKTLAVKSLAAGIAVLLAAGPAAAAIAIEAAPIRVMPIGSSALAGAAATRVGVSNSVPFTAFSGATRSAVVGGPSTVLVRQPGVALALTPAAPALQAVQGVQTAGVNASPAVRIQNALELERATILPGDDRAPARDSSAAKASADSRFDGARALPVMAAANDAIVPEGASSIPAPVPSRFAKGVSPELTAEVAGMADTIAALRAEIGKVIVGQKEMVESIIMAMIASEHVFLEGVPGVAKTQAVKAASDAVSGDFKRIQGTPDKLPSDIIGAEILSDDAEHPGMKIIKVQFGPVFTNILLVDEINRMMPKTQSALLEAMAEGQVTIGNKTYKLSKPFIVLATQNPIEQEGTYRLPEAQQDRFMFKVSVPLPSPEELLEIMDRFSSKDKQPQAGKVIGLEKLDEIRRLADRVYVDPAVKAYIANLVDATTHPEKYGVAVPKGAIESQGGAGPRAAIFLLKAARIHALMQGRAWAGPADVAAVANRVLRHRITLGFSAPRDLTTDKVVDALIATVPVPASR